MPETDVSMSFNTSWPDITAEEIKATVRRDFTADEFASVINQLTVLDSPQIQLAVLYKVKGNANLIPQYITWDWKDILASTDKAGLETFRAKRPSL